MSNADGHLRFVKYKNVLGLTKYYSAIVGSGFGFNYNKNIDIYSRSLFWKNSHSYKIEKSNSSLVALKWKAINTSLSEQCQNQTLKS